MRFQLVFVMLTCEFTHLFDSRPCARTRDFWSSLKHFVEQKNKTQCDRESMRIWFLKKSKKISIPDCRNCWYPFGMNYNCTCDMLNYFLQLFLSASIRSSTTANALLTLKSARVDFIFRPTTSICEYLRVMTQCERELAKKKLHSNCSAYSVLPKCSSLTSISHSRQSTQ